MKKVAIIEFNSYHDECLYSQILFLKESAYTVIIVANNQIYERTKEYSYLIENKILFDNKSIGVLKRLKETFKLAKILLNKEVDTVLFNTASSKLEVILLSNLLKGKVNLVGILHNLKKMNHSTSQKLINKAIKKFFVLNDFLLDSVNMKDQSVKLSSFYPIFFPKYNTNTISKSKEEIWISIPGKLDFNRRDYNILTDALLNVRSKQNLKILILGKTDWSQEKNKRFLEDIDSKGVLENFMLFDSFIKNAVFHEYIAKSDYILLPLKSVGENYSKYKIMGSYNLAFSYGKTLVSPKGLSHIIDINLHSVFYSDAKELSNVLEDISNNPEKNKKSYYNQKWDYEFQKKDISIFWIKR